MAISGRRRRLARGMTIVEVLVAFLILGTCLAAVISMWRFAFGMTVSTDDKGVAYSIARSEMEELKRTGFALTDVGTVTGTAPNLTGVLTLTFWYDALGAEYAAGTTNPPLKYKAVVTISTDLCVATGGTPAYIPADTAIRTVKIDVTALATSQVACTIGTYLVRSGV